MYRSKRRNETASEWATSHLHRASDRNKIENALVDSFGADGYKAAYARCETSPRFGTLVSIAGWHGNLAFCQLIYAAKKLADNPKTRCRLTQPAGR